MLRNPFKQFWYELENHTLLHGYVNSKHNKSHYKHLLYHTSIKIFHECTVKVTIFGFPIKFNYSAVVQNHQTEFSTAPVSTNNYFSAVQILFG